MQFKTFLDERPAEGEILSAMRKGCATLRMNEVRAKVTLFRFDFGSTGGGMEDNAEQEFTAGISADLAQAIFPIARSDRRKHKDLFKDVIPEDRLKDDDAFYKGLLKIVAAGDHARLRRYDERMVRAGDRSKSFGFRALRWLVNQTSGQFTPEDFGGLPADHFPFATPESAVHRLYLSIVETERQTRTSSTVIETHGDPTRDWAVFARELAEDALALVRPDVEAAEQLVALAEALAKACRVAAKAEAAETAVVNRAVVLRDRLNVLDQQLGATWPDDAKLEGLDEIEEAIAQAEAAFKAADEAAQAFESADLDLRKAVEARAYAQASDLSQRASKADKRSQTARALRNDSVMRLIELLRLEGAGDAPAESGHDTATATDEPESPPDRERAGFEPKPASLMVTHCEPAEASNLVAGPDHSADTAVSLLHADEPPEAQVSTDVGRAGEGASEEELSAITAAGTEILQDLNDEDLAALLARYLKNGDIAFAWHLARLRSTPTPAPILRALAILSSIQQAEDLADPRRSSALAELASSLPEAADRIAAGRLALAALLRPALFDPDHGARGHLENMLGTPGLESQTALIEALSSLGYDVRLSVGLLAELAGTRPSSAEPAARSRLAGWLTEARVRKTLHQPTYAIFHRELHPEGEIGRVAEAVLAEAVDAEALADSMIERLAHDRSAQEAFVSEAERRSGRPRRDRIEGMALDWFCRGIQEACEQLADWLESRRQDARQMKSLGPERLLRALGPIRKALAGSAVEHVEGEGALAEAAGLVLQSKLDDLSALIEGRAGIAASPRLRESLEAPLLRLPGGCQDWTEEGLPAFDDERDARDRRLAAALSTPDSIAPDEAAAFEARMAEYATLAARRLLDRRKSGEADSGRHGANLQRLDEAVEAARRRARERLARLRQSLTTIGYLDLDAATALPEDLSRLSVIDTALSAPAKGDDISLPALNQIRRPDVPPDFPELDALLSEMEARRDTLRAQIAARQRSELERLARSTQGESAEALLAIFDRLDPVTADDAIAEIKAGRAVPMPEAVGPDVFTRFYPGFVAALKAEPEESRRGRILAALEGRGSAGPLDFTNVEERRARRLRELLEVWGQGENALRQGQSARLRDALAKLFELIGFSGVLLADGRDAIPGRLRLLTMNCDAPRRIDGFLPPVFGSASGGRYHLIAARADATIDQLLRQIGGEAPDAPWIVMLFGRLDAKDRARLARQLRSDARCALVVDEALLLFAALEGDDPFATLLDCAMPFAWVQPYTISPGQIPPEIFFGREAEIDRIVARDGGGCLIYGGRQLGKSVLLNHIRGERHRPERGELALYLDIRSIGGPGTPSEEIWQSLAHDLRRLKDFEKCPIDSKNLVGAIGTWLEKDPARRLLAMFDEADNFLRAEHAAGYPNLLQLKGLMERTGRRFKAVFAGLHNVRRMARAPNSPLPHLGEPICIGPMNQTPANRSALRRLAVEPMRAAGLDYADPGLASDMLARMNYYPSLVQVFGRQIVESFGKRPRPGEEGPRWTLDRESLFEGPAAERIAEQIRDRFQLTLNLDVRYDCIARSIALHRLEATGGDSRVLAQGLTAAEVRKVTHWPKALAHPTMTDFEELLEELVDLGILSRFPDSRYGLRSAQVAQMLGRQDELEEALLRLDEREDDPAYDAALFFRLLRPESTVARAPLSDRDLQRLFDRGAPGARMVRSCPAVAGGDVAARILTAARLWLPEGDHARAAGEDAQLRRALDSVKLAPAVLVIEGAMSAASAAQLIRQTKVARGDVLPVWCAPPGAAEVRGMIVFDAGAWPEAMLRHWLADEGLAPALDDPSTREALMRATGGAPARLAVLRNILSDLTVRPVAERVGDLIDWAEQTPLSAAALGLHSADISCLNTLREFEGLDPSLEDLVAECPAATEERLEKLSSLRLLRQGREPDAAPILTPLGRLIAP
ncbi:MAG: hypothetical protein ACE37J_09390 [Pikeienuella sp.]|uniref:hypothetical protein n=1 Tax=Pikeienuella sp. TaxID=2831957 RepID=UPI00391A9ED4